MRTPSSGAETFVVREAEAGLRLDHFLAARLDGWSHRRSRAAIEGGAVSINGRRGRKGQTLRPGDVIEARLGDFIGELAAEPDLPLPIIYEDEAVVAVDKPAGMAAVALRPGDRGTVANALLGRYPELHDVGAGLEAGLVHRLDTATSGVLAAARTANDWQRLRAQFSARQVGKLYVAAVAGSIVTAGTITSALVPRPGDPRMMTTLHEPDHREEARQAITRYRPLRRWHAGTLLAVVIPTGVRHQIRVHLASRGHPVLGDPLYGDPAAGAPRLLLHAARLTLTHPRTGQRLVLRSPLPHDFRNAVRELERSPA